MLLRLRLRLMLVMVLVLVLWLVLMLVLVLLQMLVLVLMLITALILAMSVVVSSDNVVSPVRLLHESNRWAAMVLISIYQLATVISSILLLLHGSRWW